MAKAKDTLDEYGERICEALGFSPISNSTKPLTIANSLFRACTGITCDIKDMHEWVASEHKTGPSIVSSQDIRKRYKDILLYGEEESAEEIREVRFIFEKIFNPDSTVFPTHKDSVLNIPSQWFIRSTLRAEGQIGKFIFNILSGSIDGKDEISPAVKLITDSLKRDDDDITRLMKPIITSKPEKERKSLKDVQPSKKKLNFTERIIRKGFDALAENMVFTGQAKNSLLVLQRMANYTVFSIFFYLVDVNHCVYNGERIPLLLASNAELGAIERASELSFISCKKIVEEYITNLLADEIKADEILLRYDQDICRDYIEKNIQLEDKKENSNTREALLQYYDTYISNGEEPIRALARAIQFALYTYTYKNCTPSDFLYYLGVRSGFVGPRGNATKYKRLMINRFMLETIVLSAVSLKQFSEGLELRELGRLLRDKYCMLIGTDSDEDYSVLEEAKIAQEAPEDLRGELAENAKAIADMLITIGLAKRYADGVTIIGWGL